MACLAPQFKWPPSSHLHHRPFAGHSAAEGLQHAKVREPGGARIHCVMSSAAAAVVDAERHVAAGAAARQLSYGASRLGPPSAKSTFPQVKFEAALATETLLNEEAMVAAAAAQAVALARAAAEVAREAAQMVQSDLPVTAEKTDFSAKEILCDEMASGFLDSHMGATNPILQNGNSANDSLEDCDFSSILSSELEPNNAQLNQGMAVKSTRQSERRARRARAAEKTAPTLKPEKKPTASLTASLKKKWSSGSYAPSDAVRSLLWRSEGKLLSWKEEVELSKGIQDAVRLETIHKQLIELNGQPTFSQWAAAAEIDLKSLKERLDHGRFCKNRMIACNIRLVMSIARTYDGADVEYPVLVQAGCNGLARAVEKFDGTRGFRFSTYSVWWIKQAMSRCILANSTFIRLPAQMVQEVARVRAVKRRLYRELNRRPDRAELAAAAGIPLRRLDAVLRAPKYTVSLDGHIRNTTMKRHEVMADPHAKSPDALLDAMSMRREVQRILHTLDERGRQIIAWRYGLDSGQKRTLQEIGDVLGLSRERVRQIESCAFRKLKAHVKKNESHLELFLCGS